MLLSYNRLVLKNIGKCCFILLQRAKPPTMWTSATKTFATKRLQISNRHVLNICRNKTFEKRQKKQNEKRRQGGHVNQKTLQKPLANIVRTRFEHLQETKLSKKGKKQNENRPLQKNKGVLPDKIDTILQVLVLPPFKAAERKVIIK